MKSTTVSIAEGKKGFSRLIKEASERKEEIIVTRRGKPVAVIVPYEEHRHARRLEAYRMVMEGREAFLRAGLRSDEIYRESRRQLEKKR